MQSDELATRGVRVKAIRIEGDVAYVPLTKGYEAVIDAADVPLVAGRNWHAKPHRNTVYAKTTVKRESGSGKRVSLHTLLTGYPITDHRDGNGLNNRRSNLRPATNAQNQQNSRPRTKRGLKGAIWHKRDCKWQSSIRVNGVFHHLGYFETEELAHAAYCDASAKLHGEFGRVA